MASFLLSQFPLSLITNRVLFITNVDPATTFQELCAEVRDMCGLCDGHPLTLKWVDSEGGSRQCLCVWRDHNSQLGYGPGSGQLLIRAPTRLRHEGQGWTPVYPVAGTISCLGRRKLQSLAS